MKICVVGSGYVGLVTGACLADFGMEVTGVDKDERKIAALERGEIPIYEPGLEEIVEKNVKAGRLAFTTDLAPAVREAQAVFIAVGTPPLPDGSADLSFVRQVAQSIGENLNGFKVVITKSTVPVGTGQMVEEIVSSVSGGNQEFAVVSNPEFLREGSAIEDFLRPDRVVIGARSQRAVEVMLEIYAPLKVAGVPFVVANVESAEMIKYASNGFLATKITFVNEIAEICEAVGADVEVVARGMGLDSRIGPRFLQPGPGFGGSCFPKDTRAVGQIARERGLEFAIIDAVLAANERTKQRMVGKIERAFGGLDGKTIALLGLAFKGDTDDMRESPAIPIVEGLVAGGATVRAFDPCGDAGGPVAAAADRILRRSVHRRHRRRRRGDRHRVEPVPRPQPRRAPEPPRHAAARRPAQPLRAGAGRRRRVALRLGGTRRGRSVKTAVVTGGAGFLGSHLCERLVAEGMRVVAVDNLVTGKRENLRALDGSPAFSFLLHDVSRPFTIAGPVDYVLHFASPASPIDYLELPIQTLKVGSLGTHNGLGLAKAKGARFLLASTSEVYGDPLVHPQPESYWGNVNPVGPRGVYDEAKRFAEAMVMAYHRVHGLDTRIVRIFNTYGPRMRPRDGRVVPAFLQQALTGRPLTVFGDGSQTRSFCYVDDLIEGIYRLLLSAQTDPVNIGNPHEMTILEFAETIRAAVGGDSEIVFEPLPVDDPKTRQPDISLAREVLGWEPRISLDEGIRRTLDYFREVLARDQA